MTKFTKEEEARIRAAVDAEKKKRREQAIKEEINRRINNTSYDKKV